MQCIVVGEYPAERHANLGVRHMGDVRAKLMLGLSCSPNTIHLWQSEVLAVKEIYIFVAGYCPS